MLSRPQKPLVTKTADAEETEEDEESDEEQDASARPEDDMAEERREAPSSLSPPALADDADLLLPAPAPPGKPSPKEPKVVIIPPKASIKRASSKDIVGSPQPDSSKQAKKEASPVAAAVDSGKKGKRVCGLTTNE